MKKRPDTVVLNGSTLDSLYPFHLIISGENGLTIEYAGPNAREFLCEPAESSDLLHHFTIERPLMVSTCFTQLQQSTDKLIILSSNSSQQTLRGQLVPIGKIKLLFLGTLNIKTSESIKDAGLSLNTFPPHDLSPDLVILQRIKEMQLEELSRQNTALSLAIRERDQFGHYANTDAMTQLLNRRGFLIKARECLQSDAGLTNYWILHIDINNFKVINDTYGHSAGDAILCELAIRLRKQFSASGIIGRWGGDEFVVLTNDESIQLTDGETIPLIDTIRFPVNYNDKAIELGLSTGIVSSAFSLKIEKLIHYADLTMYEGKAQGRDRDEFFYGKMRSRIELREKITRLFKPAMERGEIVPFFQPIVDLKSGELTGFEALARWTSSEIGDVSPIDFIAIAESKNLLVEFDMMMLDLVARQLSEWHRDFPDICVHVNFSGPSFGPGLLQNIQSVLETYCLPNNVLVIELTETSLLLDSSKTMEIIDQLVSCGFSVELDDFGTGYSSLMHLKDFSVTGLKVDTSFVKEALEHDRSKRLLAGILEMSNLLDLHSVAEGVETAEQLELLQSMHCDSAQGYYFSRPLPASDCHALLLQPQLFTDIPKVA